VECEVFTIQKNRQEQVRFRLREYNGHQLLDVRVFEPDSTGRLKPSKRGVSVNVNKVDELIEGLMQARGEFAKSGLI
jgi:hypothetical protein